MVSRTLDPREDGRRAGPSHSPAIQKLDKYLDLTQFLVQLEKLLSQPIKIPNSSGLPYPGTQNRMRQSIFSVKGIWNNEADRDAEVQRLYNVRNAGPKRAWLKELLLEESDSESEGEIMLTEHDLLALCKVHRRRRAMQKRCHSDPLNKQFMYYGAGLLSTHDPFPEHQNSVLRHYGSASTPSFSNFDVGKKTAKKNEPISSET